MTIWFAVKASKAQGQTIKHAAKYVPSLFPSPSPPGQLFVTFFLRSSFNNVAVSIVERNEQRTENGALLTSLLIEKCFNVSNM
jgi:hypothetical protein